LENDQPESPGSGHHSGAGGCLRPAALAEKPTLVEVTNPVLSVEVSNADPVAVSVAPPAEKYQRSVGNRLWDPTTATTSIIQVTDLHIPSDKVLVVEYVSADVYVNPGEKAFFEIICQGAGLDVLPATITLPLTNAGQFLGKDILIGGSPVTCYAGSSSIADLIRDSAAPVGTTTSTISLVGYLIDKTQ
jgi:hypothetical protein